VQPGYVSTLDAAIDMFDIYRVPIVAGRGFNSADPGASSSVVVNRTFTMRFFGDRPGLGLRFRYSPAPGQPGGVASEWYQIVGVVADFPRFSPDGSGPTVYHPAALGDDDSVTLSVRFNGGIPPRFAERFRKIVADVDPALQLRRVRLLSEFYEEQQSLWHHLAWAIAWVTTSVVLLSAAGIYAMMSFSVTQRTREIGIRSALGASPHRLLVSVFGRASRQLAAGICAGVLVSGAAMLSSGVSGRVAVFLLIAVAGLMSGIALLAAVGPARRGLRMHASEALRAEG
jgi:hypothetical protein